MSWTRPPGPTLFSAALPKNMTGNRVSTVSSCRRRPPPKYTELWSPTSEELLSHLGHCWAKLAGAAPKGVIAPILRNDRRQNAMRVSQVDISCELPFHIRRQRGVCAQCIPSRATLKSIRPPGYYRMIVGALNQMKISWPPNRDLFN